MAEHLRQVDIASYLGVLEGENGVGKTSVVAVASYRLLQRWYSERSGPLFIPLCLRPSRWMSGRR